MKRACLLVLALAALAILSIGLVPRPPQGGPAEPALPPNPEPGDTVPMARGTGAPPLEAVARRSPTPHSSSIDDAEADPDDQRPFPDPPCELLVIVDGDDVSDLGAEDHARIEQPMLYAWLATESPRPGRSIEAESSAQRGRRLETRFTELEPGPYLLVLGGARARRVDLAPGENRITIGAAAHRYGADLLFVDAVDGTPVEVDRVWLSFWNRPFGELGKGAVVLGTPRYVGADHLRLEAAPAPWVQGVAVTRRSGSSPFVTDLRSAGIQAIEIERRVVLELVNQRSDDPLPLVELAQDTRLRIAGERVDRLSLSSSRGRVRLYFPGVTAEPGRWSLELPDDVAATTPAGAALVPGEVVQVRVERTPEQP